MTHITIVDKFAPKSGVYEQIYNASLVIGGSIVLALASKMAFFTPFSPVPVTMQTLAVLVIAALYGYKRGVATVIAFLVEGAVGLPVFATGGGLAYMFGPTGGYLIGFVVAAFIVGSLSERGWDRSFIKSGFAMILGSASILILGASWLSLFVGSFSKAVTVGVAPFVIGELFKVIIAYLALPLGWKILGSKK